MWPSIGPIRAYGMLYLLGIVLHFVLGRRIAKHYGLQAAGVDRGKRLLHARHDRRRQAALRPPA